MLLPNRRWYVVAAALALLAPLALVWPGGGALLLTVDLVWVLALAVDGWRVTGIPIEKLDIAREAPPAFSVGRSPSPDREGPGGLSGPDPA
jgi:hypothetical protein